MTASRGHETIGPGGVGVCRPPSTRASGCSRAWRWLALGCVGAGLVSGCGDSKKPDVARLNPRGVPFLEGVPVPQGFGLVDDMVMDNESGGQRTAQHVYRGGADPYAVRNFYREQMPLMGWDRVSDHNFKGVITIRCEKSDEACTVEIRSTGTFGSKTLIRVFVQPFNRTPLEPPKQPVP